MRKVKLSNGKEYTIESMTGKEVRKLRSGIGETNGIDETFEFAKKAGVKEEDMDELPFIELQHLKDAFFAETFGIEKEVKN